MEKTENIYNTALEIFKFADDNNITTHNKEYQESNKNIWNGGGGIPLINLV